jgi:phosphoenolpyruvate carboxykinase (ATP)
MASSTAPMPTRESSTGLNTQGLTPKGAAHWNFVPAELAAAAARRGEGEFAEMGPFVAVTTPHTGRSPKDKFVVQEPSSQADVDWGAVNQPMDEAHFETLLADVRGYLNTQGELFVQDLYCGADPAYRLSCRYVTPNAWHANFVRNMFIRPAFAELASFAPNFSILHAPDFQADPKKHGTRTTTFIVLNIAKRMILIGGTRYAGELKKSMFTVMNYLLPKQGVLSMHCSANIGPAGDTALFFGLSGTGKTTLSADPARGLIGDDEHGWSENGTFNFEGGCYAKVINLSPEQEPDIYQTTQMFGTILENVELDPLTKKVKFESQKLTENTRASYPLHYIKNHVPSGRGGHPKNVVFLTADAFGVLPPIAKLTKEQAMYYFLSGEGCRYRDWSERAAGDVQRLLRRGLPRLASHQVRAHARRAARHAQRERLAREHRLERRRLRHRLAHEAHVHPRDGARAARRLTRECAGEGRSDLRALGADCRGRCARRHPRRPR